MKPVVVLGETLLRLKSPGHERLFQSPVLEATFGGAESNVAASLARLGHEVRYVSALPVGPVGDACIRELRSHGVDIRHVQRGGDRIGVYFLEAGSNQRPSTVTYDRGGSALAAASPDAFDWDLILAGAGWFHFSGITPAVSPGAAEIALRAARTARALGIPVSCDYNHRAKLWRYGKEPPEVMGELMPYVTLGIAGREDCQKMLGVEVDEPAPGGELDPEWFRSLAERVLERFPNLLAQVITLREGRSADSNAWSACYHDRERFRVSRRYEIDDIVDRVGAGDAFTAGLIHGLLSEPDPRVALEIATAAGCLKHSIPGDVNLVGDAELRALVRGDGSGRIAR